MHVSAIIAAGGRGLRLGSSQPKQLLSIGGRPILERSVAAFLAHPLIDEVIVALPQDLADPPPRYLQHATKPLRIVAGGDRRRDSVANAFQFVAERAEVVVVHDAARPFATADLISRTIGAAAESGAALAAVQARDTVKRGESSSKEEHGEWVVTETLARESIFLAQTPQAFRRNVLRDALSVSGDATDEAVLAERAGYRVRLVEGEWSNIKITTAKDLEIAEAIAGRHQTAVTRIGTGYDLHRLVEGRPLVLGGVTVPAERGALGHSDADVVCHSVTDALLGAGGLGDIGQYFPDADSQWKNASSLDLLARTMMLIAQHGLEIGNVDITVVLERPKLRPYIDAMRRAVATAMNVDAAYVSIKAKTNEGVGAIGRGEAIAAHAVALLRTR